MTGSDVALIEQNDAQLAPLSNPRAFVAGYTLMADELARIIKAKKLAVSIQGRDHVRVEGWTLLGSMLGVFPICVWTRPLLEDGEKVGWEARVEARTRDGSLVGAAEAECMRSEKTWASRDDYALRSMAQTRATSKALRQPLGFVVTLAGFDPTPAEEMPNGAFVAPTEPNSADPMITDPQRKRLFAKAKTNKIDEQRLRALIVEVTGQESTKFIPKTKYDELIDRVELEAIPFE